MSISRVPNDYYTKAQSDKRYASNKVLTFSLDTRYPKNVMTYYAGVFWKSLQDSDVSPNIGYSPSEANSLWWEEVSEFDEGLYYTQVESDARFLGISDTAVSAQTLSSSPKINNVEFTGADDIIIGVEAADVVESSSKVFVTYAQREQLASVELQSNKGQANGYVGLNSSGKIPSSYLPSLSTVEVYVVDNEAEMLLLNAEIADQAVRTDLVSNNVFILTQLPATDIDNWTRLNTSASVGSVNGYTGIVVIDKSDVGLAYADNTSDLDKPISTATQDALDLKATVVSVTNHTSSTSNPHSVTASQVGLWNVDNTSDLNKPISTATQTALNLKAPLASPALTGTPTAPTATVGTNTTQVATTAFVNSSITSLDHGALSGLSDDDHQQYYNAARLAALMLSSFASFFHAQDQKPSGTDAGSTVSGTQTRVLNTIVQNSISGASLSSNRVTLPAGTYYVDASAPVLSGRHRAFLYNVTNSEALLQGTAEWNSTTAVTRSFVQGLFTITATKSIELRHYTATARATEGLGAYSNSGDVEVYADIKIWKVA